MDIIAGTIGRRQNMLLGMGSVKELPVPFVLRRDGCNDPAKFVDRIDISAGDSSNNFQKALTAP